MSPLRRWGRRALWAGAALLVLALAFGLWVRLACFAEPPVLDPLPVIVELEVVQGEDGRAHLGRSWFQREEGRSLLYVAGSPYEIGRANAMLTAEWMELQERSLMETVEAALPSFFVRLAVGVAVLVNNRHLPDYVPDEYQLEVLGLASADWADPFPYMGPRYHRILNYHAAHDISHWVWDEPVLGCTAFAVRDEMTPSGELLVGRNFDWEGGDHFDRNKVIALYEPERGHAFLSVSWPGMAGAITGLNADRIYCSVNGAHSTRRSNIGRPVSLVVREVLQYASDLDEAIRIIADAPVFVADSYLVVDGETRRAAVVEKAPGLVAIRELEGATLVQSNHFLTPAFADDAGNAEYMREGTSVARHARLAELLAERAGELDVPTAVAVLRDRLGPGGKARAAGHRGTINPMIATHSVVAEVERGVLWVSRGPHQLGAYDAYRIEDFGSSREVPVEADAALSDGVYDRVREQRDLLARLARTWEADRPLRPEERELLERAWALGPDDPGLAQLRARAAELDGEGAEAAALYHAVLRAEPPFASHRREVEAALARLEGPAD